MVMLKKKPKKTRKIYLLLTEFPDAGTKFIKALMGLEYPHASIGLEEDMNTFYSFVTKGFIVEKINRYVKPGRKAVPCKLYEMKVSEDVYFKIKKAIEYFIEFRELFYYSRMSLALSIFKLPYRNSRFGFFCSQFVAYILQKGQAYNGFKSVNQCFSDDLSAISGMRLKYCGDLKSMMDNSNVLFCTV